MNVYLCPSLGNKLNKDKNQVCSFTGVSPRFGRLPGQGSNSEMLNFKSIEFTDHLCCIWQLTGYLYFHLCGASLTHENTHAFLREFTQTHIHWVGDVIQPSHPLLSPSPPAPNPSQHQSMSQLFAWPGQSIGVSSALASFLPKNTLNWSPLGWTGWISLQSKGLSRVFSNTTVQKHQFFSAQLSSQSNSRIHTWPLEKP